MLVLTPRIRNSASARSILAGGVDEALSARGDFHQHRVVEGIHDRAGEGAAGVEANAEARARNGKAVRRP